MADVPDPELESELQLQVNENVGMEPMDCPRCGAALTPGEITSGGKVTATCPSCEWPAAADAVSANVVSIDEPADDEPARMTYPPFEV